MTEKKKQDPTDPGMNRTGIDMSPVDSKKLIEGALKAVPSSVGSDEELKEARRSFIAGADAVGSTPLPTTLKGAVATVGKMVTGGKESAFLDKLGERLAFERTGARLYEALLAKCSTINGGRKLLERLEEIHNEEMRHYSLVAAAIRELGGDPTAQTPCADVVGVATQGVLQVLADPRTTVSQCLTAILMAELADTEGWHMLITLANALGHAELVGRFQGAAKTELEHVAFIRSVLVEMTVDSAAGSKHST